jgi:hypothetical protein
MRIESRWNNTDGGKTEELGENPVPVPLCSPQISHGLTRVQSRASAVRGILKMIWGLRVRYEDLGGMNLAYHGRMTGFLEHKN